MEQDYNVSNGVKDFDQDAVRSGGGSEADEWDIGRDKGVGTIVRGERGAGHPYDGSGVFRRL